MQIHPSVPLVLRSLNDRKRLQIKQERVCVRWSGGQEQSFPSVAPKKINAVTCLSSGPAMCRCFPPHTPCRLIRPGHHGSRLENESPRPGTGPAFLRLFLKSAPFRGGHSDRHRPDRGEARPCVSESERAQFVRSGLHPPPLALCAGNCNTLEREIWRVRMSELP